MPVVQLTNKFIKQHLVCPENKSRIEFCCDDLKGLFVEVRRSAKNQGTYFFRYKDAHKKTCTVKIGLTADVTLKQARAKAKELRADVSLGKDPKEYRDKQRQVPTLAEYMINTYMHYAKQHKRTWRNDEQMFERHIEKRFGHLRLSNIKRGSVQSFHTQLREEGLAPATCDHYIKLLRRLLNHAVDNEVIDVNPLVRLKLFNADNKKERYLSDEELSRLINVLKAHENRMVSSIVLFLLSTGARLNEALTATWENIDVTNKTWRVSASISKSKKMRAIPLNSTAINVLNEVGTEDKSEYVFINTKTGKPYICIKNTWTHIREQAGLVGFRLHDLRHNYASMLVNSGRSLYEVQHILGHSDPKVTQRYAHLSTETLHEAVDAVSNRLSKVEKPRETPSEPPQTVLRVVAGGKT